MRPRPIPDSARVPLKLAHHIIGKGSSTVYRWAEKGALPTADSPDGLTVLVGDLRKVEASMRHGGRREKKAEQTSELLQN